MLDFSFLGVFPGETFEPRADGSTFLDDYFASVDAARQARMDQTIDRFVLDQPMPTPNLEFQLFTFRDVMNFQDLVIEETAAIDIANAMSARFPDLEQLAIIAAAKRMIEDPSLVPTEDTPLLYELEFQDFFVEDLLSAYRNGVTIEEYYQSFTSIDPSAVYAGSFGAFEGALGSGFAYSGSGFGGFGFGGSGFGSSGTFDGSFGLGSFGQIGFGSYGGASGGGGGSYDRLVSSVQELLAAAEELASIYR